MKSNLKAYFKLHFIIFIWGFTAVLGALIRLDYFTLTWYRMGLASTFLFIYLIINEKRRKQLFQFDLKNQFRYIIGGIIIALHWIAFFYAIKASNVSITLITMSSGAFFTSLIEPLFFKRKIYFYEILFGLLILLGFIVLIKVENIAYTGVYFALIAAFLSGLFSVMNGIYIRTKDAYTLSFYQLFYGFLFLSFTLAVKGDLIQMPHPTRSDWIYLLILASICTAYAFSESIHLMKYLSPYTVMISINLEPVYGIILAIIVLGNQEKMSERFYIGGLIILTIIIINAMIKYKAKKNP